MATAREGTRVAVRSPEERNGYPGSSLNLGALLSPTVADRSTYDRKAPWTRFGFRRADACLAADAL